MFAASRRGFPVREPAHPARQTVLSPTASRHLISGNTDGDMDAQAWDRATGGSPSGLGTVPDTDWKIGLVTIP
jgi:hypothetical protein